MTRGASMRDARLANCKLIHVELSHRRQRGHSGMRDIPAERASPWEKGFATIGGSLLRKEWVSQSSP